MAHEDREEVVGVGQLSAYNRNSKHTLRNIKRERQRDCKTTIGTNYEKFNFGH